MIQIDSACQTLFSAVGLFDWVESLDGEIYRVGPGRVTLRFEHGGQAFFLKRHTGVGWREIFKELLQVRLPVLGAMNEWRALERLRAINVPSLQPVACGEQGWNPATRKSFLITRELEDTISLEELVLNWRNLDNFMLIKRRVIRQVAMLARRIHGHGLNHRDMYICHLHIKKSWLSNPEGDPILFVIDLHRAQIRSKVPVRWLVKDIASLYFSSMDAGLTHRDYLRFVKQYCRQSLRDALSTKRQFWFDVQRRAKCLYAAHSKPSDKSENTGHKAA